MPRRLLITTALILFSLLPVSQVQCARLSREAAIEDIRRLAYLLETVHPDPYSRGGGKIAFHRTLQEVLLSVPDDGLDREDLYRLLCPLVAFVGDAHTQIRDPYSFDSEGITFFFDIVDETLFVRGVPKEEYRELIGARLVSIEKVPFDEIVHRQGKLTGYENRYTLLKRMGGRGALWQRCYLQDLLPEWKDTSVINVELELPDGEVKNVALDLPIKMTSSFIVPKSRLKLPSTTRCDFAYHFLDRERKTALLVVRGMSGYRETFERRHGQGQAIPMDRAREAYKRYNGENPPESTDELIAGLPSATETFRSLVTEMKEAGTTRLLIDLRRNEGGDSSMSDFLIYFLYGKTKLIALKSELTEIKKYSKYFFAVNEGMSIDEINKGRDVPLDAGGSTRPRSLP
jgi:hypothetical protein